MSIDIIPGLGLGLSLTGGVLLIDSANPPLVLYGSAVDLFLCTYTVLHIGGVYINVQHYQAGHPLILASEHSAHEIVDPSTRLHAFVYFHLYHPRSSSNSGRRLLLIACAFPVVA